MLHSIKGYYDQGKIVLSEQPPVENKTDVIITFLTEQKKEVQDKPKRVLGGLKGKIVLTDEFDEPLDEMKEYM